jgi:hypothetical protein
MNKNVLGLDACVKRASFYACHFIDMISGVSRASIGCGLPINDFYSDASVS